MSFNTLSVFTTSQDSQNPQASVNPDDPYFHASGYLYCKELWWVLQLTLPAPRMQNESIDFSKAHSESSARKPSYEYHTSESLLAHQDNLSKSQRWKYYLINAQ